MLRPSLARAALPILIAAEAVLFALAVRHPFDQSTVLRFESIGLVVFGLAVGALAAADLTPRIARGVIVGASVLFALIAITKPASHSDDVFRYIWDATVQLAGVDPYRYTPSDPHLAGLRTEYLFPTERPCPAYRFPDGCTRINLPTHHTIYPPVAQAAFVLIRLASWGGHGHQLPYQLAATLGSVVITVLLLRLRRDRSTWPVAIWAWCPVTILELSSNAHIDWLGVVCAIGALLLYQRGRPLAAGLLLGAGVATKIYPGVVGAAMLRRRPWLVVLGAAGLVVGSYVPHVVAVGTKVIGFLPTYLSAGGYGDGRTYRLLSVPLPSGATTPVAAAIFVITALAVARRADPGSPQYAALVMVGVTALVTTPVLPWYALLLLALAAGCDRPEWLGVVVAPTFVYLLAGTGHASPHNAVYLYGAGLVVVVIGTLLRRRSDARRGGRSTPVPATSSGAHNGR